jgi:hypothetical protein
VPRPPRTGEEVVVPAGLAAIALSDISLDAGADEEVVGRIQGGAETPLASIGAEGAPVRKRKRRRRRGERKERTPGDATAPSASDAGTGDEGDGGFDDASNDAEARSPYSSLPPAAPVESQPPTPPPLPPSHLPSSEPPE